MTTDALVKKPTALWKLTPLSFIVLNGILAVSAMIAAHLSWGLAVVIAVILGLTTITISFFYREPSFSWTALMAVIAALICGLSITGYYDLKDREIIRDISLAETINHPEAGGYHFTEGNVRTDLMGTHVRRSKSSNRSSTVSYYYAAPVVPDSWRPGQAVTVWAVQQSTLRKERWEQPLRAGLRTEALFKEELEAAVADAINSHNLTSHPKAVMIEWVESPEAAVTAYLDEFKETALVLNILWLIGLLAGRAFLSRRRKKKKPADIPAPDAAEPKEYKPIATPDLIRFLFVVYCLLALAFALYFSTVDFSTFLPITLLVVGIVFFIVAAGALLTAHKKEDRPLLDLLIVAAYPYLVYLLTFLSLDVESTLFWMFPGFFYFLVITGGFVLGILFSPFMALGFREGLKTVGKMGPMKYVGLVLAGVFGAVAWFFTRFLSNFTELTSFQSAVFWFFLLVGVLSVIKFSYRHTSFNLAQNPVLRRKYSKPS